MVYLHARYYDPAIARFVSADPSNPLAPGVGLNRYAYAGNDPINNSDPSGLCAGVCIGIGLGVFTTVAVVHDWWNNTPEGLRLQEDLKTLNRVPRAIALAPVAVMVSLSESNEHAADGDSNDDAEDGESDPVQGLLDRTRPGPKTKGPTTIRTDEGGFEQANKDFDDIVDPDTVKDQGDGKRSGVTPGGLKVTVRPGSTDGRPTLEIRRPSGRGTEIRYNPAETKGNDETKEDKSE